MKKSTNPYLQTRDTSGKFIFICYSHFDRKIVEPILEQFSKDGYRFWFDDGTRGGKAWQDTVAEVIEKSTVFLFLTSGNAVKSTNCKNELFFAAKKGKTIVSVFLSKVELEKCGGVALQLSSDDPISFYEYKKDELPFFFKTLYDSENINLCKRSDKEQHDFLKKISQANNPDNKEVADKAEEKNKYKQLSKSVIPDISAKNTSIGHNDRDYSPYTTHLKKVQEKSKNGGNSSGVMNPSGKISAGTTTIRHHPNNTGRGTVTIGNPENTGRGTVIIEKPKNADSGTVTIRMPENAGCGTVAIGTPENSDSTPDFDKRKDCVGKISTTKKNFKIVFLKICFSITNQLPKILDTFLQVVKIVIIAVITADYSTDTIILPVRTKRKEKNVAILLQVVKVVVTAVITVSTVTSIIFLIEHVRNLILSSRTFGIKDGIGIFGYFFVLGIFITYFVISHKGSLNRKKHSRNSKK